VLKQKLKFSLQVAFSEEWTLCISHIRQMTVKAFTALLPTKVSSSLYNYIEIANLMGIRSHIEYKHFHSNVEELWRN
jgi:hypothetical protein